MVRLVVKRLALGATGALAFALSACSGPSHETPPFYVAPTAAPSAAPTSTPTGGPTPTAAPTNSPTPVVTPTPSGSATPTQTPSPAPTLTAKITGSLTSIVVCTQVQMTCGQDLNPNATSGEDASVLVLGARGTLSYTNEGGPAVGTMVSQVYGTQGSNVEYEVLYKSATATPTTDVLTISDSGTKSSLTIPVTIISPGTDAGASFFALYTASGIVCPGRQVVFETRTQGNATVTLAASDPNLIAIGQNGTGNFALDVLKPGSGIVTATGGASTVIYPANIPVPGFTTNC